MAEADRTLRFEPAAFDHLPSLLRNETRSYAFPWTEGVFRDCISGPQDCWVAVEPGGQLIGHAILSLVAGEAHLLNLCIARDRQGLGYGRQFMRFILRSLTDGGAEVLFLEVRPSNRVAIALYQSMGFREIGVRKDYYPAPLGREDARVLALQFRGPASPTKTSSTTTPVPRTNFGRDHFGAV